MIVRGRLAQLRYKSKLSDKQMKIEGFTHPLPSPENFLFVTMDGIRLRIDIKEACVYLQHAEGKIKKTVHESFIGPMESLEHFDA